MIPRQRQLCWIAALSSCRVSSSWVMILQHRSRPPSPPSPPSPPPPPPPSHLLCSDGVWHSSTLVPSVSTPTSRVRNFSLYSSASMASLADAALALQQSYDENESDGVLDFAISTDQQQQQQQQQPLSARQVWDLVHQASRGRTGTAATMLNAWLGSYCCLPPPSLSEVGVAGDTSWSSLAALELLDLWEQQQQQQQQALETTAGGRGVVCQPDLMTYALTYTAVIRSLSLSSQGGGDDDSSSEIMAAAQSVLNKGIRWSKKAAGSKRRKALAAAHRRQRTAVDTATNRIEDIRSLVGGEFNVLKETDDYVVVYKPSGVVCSHTRLTTAGNPTKKKKAMKKQQNNNNNNNNNNNTDDGKIISSFDISLVDALLACNVPLSTLNPESQGLVHRLDRGTSGCLFLAKTDQVHAQAVSEFFLRRTTKTYAAIVAPYSPSSTISIRRDDNGHDHHHHHHHDHDRSTIVIDLPVDGRPAKSSFRVMERFGCTTTTTFNNNNNNSDGSSRGEEEVAAAVAALVEVTTFTGRKHQVRVHSARGLHSPILRDSLYKNGTTTTTTENNNKRTSVPQFPDTCVVLDETDNKERFFLHAQSLKLPCFGVHVEAPLPKWWEPTLDALRKLEE